MRKSTNPYISGSKSKGTTLREEMKYVKASARKTKHEPDFVPLYTYLLLESLELDHTKLHKKHKAVGVKELINCKVCNP